MSTKSDQFTLNELRDKSQKTNSEVPFKKKFLGGYNAKQVSEYIETLSDNLHSAEGSFKNRLDEYASMTAMLKQERDQYGEMFNVCKNSKMEMQDQIDHLTRENEKLNNEIVELNQNNDSAENDQMYEKIAAQNLEMQIKLNEYRNYEQECIQLKDQLDQLKLMIQDLNDELGNYAKNDGPEENLEKVLAENEILKKKSDEVVHEKRLLLAENEILKKQYEEVVHERSVLLAEKNMLAELNIRASDSLQEANEKNKELVDITIKTKLKTRKMIAEFESRAYEYSQNHQKNIDEISETIKKALDILKYEKEDVDLLIKKPLEDSAFLVEEEELSKSE
ncbi:hypothetical protein GH810_11505 [Acetobacterium paludosum]|uniref:Uncharacterized protein n=1 Tax=Acetobacterium paludosum TaxID=52693 RepID=A0A923HYI0_9FIRM|nr:hypothetical protein [Acetobacterium paludosum]MBC3888939.1 hypothetical protein [Acetobacterium paludosum]